MSRRYRARRARAAAMGWLLAAGSLALAAGTSSAEESVGTFSIVAYDSTTGEVGVAVQSRVFGVGVRVAWARGGIGAIATQASSNESFGPNGLTLLEAGLTAQETLDKLLGDDEGRSNRQVGVVDAGGGVANWTGTGCSSWAGDSAGVGVTCQGNILTGPDVVTDMIRAFRRTSGEELARRMIAALEAGQAAGGDSRGQQSAAILIGRYHPQYPEYTERYVDIRVDDHEQPIAELHRLYEMYEAQGMVQAHMRFAAWREEEGDDGGAQRERDRVGRALEWALEGSVEDAGMLNSLAWFTAINDIYLPQALIAAKKAVELEPENTAILDTLAEVYFRLGRVDEAIDTITGALALAPDDGYLKEQLERFRAGKK